MKIIKEKKYFHNIASNYELDKNNNLCIKISIKNKENKIEKKNSRHKYNNYELMKVPFVRNIKNYLYEIHKNNNHLGLDSFLKLFLSKKIYYKGIVDDLYNIIKTCTICKIKNKTIKLTKKEKFELIIFTKPRERYIGDLTLIPSEFLNNIENKFYDSNKKYKYIFTIIDHFSKFSQSYSLKDKKRKYFR